MSLVETVIVTGANGDIGNMLVQKLIKENYNVIATVRNPNSEFSNWCSRLEKGSGVTLTCEILNLDDANLAQAQLREILSKHPDALHLVNNAAIAFGSTVLMTPIKSLRRVFEVNLFSQFALSQIFTKHLLKSRKGSITNISSTAASVPLPGSFVYGSSKLALEYMTEVLASELFNTQIRISAIELGPVNTKMLSQMDRKSMHLLISSSTLKRVLSPSEAADSIFYHAFQSNCNCPNLIHVITEESQANER